MLKTFLFMKIILRAGSGLPEPSPSYAALGLDYWRTSHDALSPSLLSSPFVCIHIPSMHVTYLASSLSHSFVLFHLSYVEPALSYDFFLFPSLPSLVHPLSLSIFWSITLLKSEVRQMATLPETTYTQAFHLLKGSFLATITKCLLKGNCSISVNNIIKSMV